MKVKDMQTLYVQCLQDMYSAESQLVEALPKVASAVTSDKLKEAVKEHLSETKTQRDRLEKIFKELGEEPGEHECQAMKGLIKEADELIEEVETGDVLDAALIGAAQKVEHYEIAGYGTARTYAALLGYEEQVDLLESTLEEESNCDATLTDIAEETVNEDALASGEDSEESEAPEEEGSARSK